MDYRWRGTPLSPVSINGVDVQLAREYKYIELCLDSKPDWSGTPRSCARRVEPAVHFENAPLLHRLQEVPADVPTLGRRQ